MAKENRDQKNAPEGKKTENSLNSIRFRLLFTYVFLISIAVWSVSIFTINITFSVMQEKTGSLLTSFNTQMGESIGHYFSHLRERAALAFAEPQNYQYDPTTEPAGEEKTRILDEISKNMRFVSLTENYSDFAILYRDGEHVGRLSSGTDKLFGGALFGEMEKAVNDGGRHDGLVTGYGGDYRRIYYANRVNDNAILIVSFYALDLDNLFDFSQNVQQEMAVRLLDGKNYIVYSSLHEEIGQELPEEMAVTLEEHKSAALSDHAYLYNVKTCMENWRVVSTIPMETIRKEYDSVRLYVILMAVLVVVVTIILAHFLSNVITNPLNSMVYGLNEKAEFDLLTGIYNKMTFEHYAEEMLNSPDREGSLAYFLSDVDDFKLVNDICGHSAGDRVLQKYGRILADIFHRDVPGRIGGDEFAALVEIPSTENPYVYMGKQIDTIRKRVAQIHEENADIHVSIGVAIRKDSSATLTDLYRNADRALYETKRRGKNGYTFYSAEKMDGEGGGQA